MGTVMPEPPPVFKVVELHPTTKSPGLWIGFKTVADRDSAMNWFKVQQPDEAAGG